MTREGTSPRSARAAEPAAASEVHLAGLRAATARVLGMLDRDPHGRTFGCFDRTWWAWKFTDFPGARFQEGLCYLGFLHATEFEGNALHKSPALLRWIAGGFDFWARIQRASGDFDEAYPLERSLAATAFTTHYLSEAWNFVGEDLPRETAERFLAALERAGDWLCANDETHGFLSNHLAAAASALLHAWRITGAERFRKRAWHFLDKILAHQSSEGWYDEYGGADPGYQTHGSYYLARCLELTGDKRLFESLERSFEFLSHFAHVDGSLGGEYASRNTQTYYPAAFEMLAGRSGRARWIAERMRPSVATLDAAGLGSVDRYNLFPLLNNAVFAYLAAVRNEREGAAAPDGPPDALVRAHFPSAGLLVERRERYELVVGLSKGGVVKLFDRERGRLVFSDCGFVGNCKDGASLSSQWIDPERVSSVEEDGVRTAGRLYLVSRPVMDPARFLGFRAFSLTLGRVPRLARWLKATLVKALVYRSRELDLRLEREVVLHDDGIELVDRLRGPDGARVEALAAEANFTTIHMGSSRYYVPNEAAAGGALVEGDDAAVDVARLVEGVELRRRVRIAS